MDRSIFGLLILSCIAMIHADVMTFQLWYGTTYTCEVCGEYNFTSTSDPNWNYGERYFNDPLPSGSSVNQIMVTTTAMYWCGSTPVEIELYSNNEYLGYAESSDSNACLCGSCAAPQTLNSSYYQSGDPYYTYGGQNSVTVYQLSGTYIGISYLTITLIYTNGNPTGQNTSTTVTYNGCGPCLLCSGSDYTLSNGKADCGVGTWNDGMSYFIDPVPSGNIVTQITVITTTVFWCDPPTQVTFLIGNYTVGTSPTVTTSHCYCNECTPARTITSMFYSSGFPGYQYGDVNDFQTIVNNGIFGVANLEVILSYTPMDASKIQP